MSRFSRLRCLLAVCVAVAVAVLLSRARRPRDADACFERGNALLGAGNYAEACEQYARAVETNPRHAYAFRAS